MRCKSAGELTETLNLNFPALKEGPQSLVNAPLNLVAQDLEVEEDLDALGKRLAVSAFVGIVESD